MQSNKPSLILQMLLICHLSVSYNSADTVLETIENISYRDSNGIEHEEYAFRAPMKGIPNNVLDLYCANIKLRLYWDVFRQEIKEDRTRTDIFLRRLARMARYTFDEIRDVDDPFQAKRLSIIDKHFALNTVDDKKDDNNVNWQKKDSIKISDTLKAIKNKFRHNKDRAQLAAPLLETETECGLEKGPQTKLVETLKSAYRYYAPKVGMGIYTRWKTMWWLTMPCIFAKYYLWDPALDEFIKLKRTMVMYPDFLQLKLQDIECKPVKFFRRILDVCKILNPLMHISFGQLSLDQMIRFKKDTMKD